MDINGYPIQVPQKIENKDYGLKFTGDAYKVIALSELQQGVKDLDQLVLDRMKEDPKYLKRVQLKYNLTKKDA